MPDFILSLGEVGFFGWEVPDHIAMPGGQHLAVHTFLGGTRQIHAQGRNDEAISWAGRFRGPFAALRSRQVQAMALAGLPVLLMWDAFAYFVVIRRFVPDFHKFYEIPYELTVEVLSDEAMSDIADDGINAAMQLAQDLIAMALLATAAGGTALPALVATAANAVRDALGIL